ncbi:MAG: formylglycine-generating enzyme family protein [Candidatus Aminicenantes bacterium]|nr:MAG: formylglycine-generating enzyme family protein [Candidatus Aminicenantes bacterium]UCH98407.1 MAG: formylglycine-generating enzyme family protein [Candidatus Aminicenantes bacterium]
MGSQEKTKKTLKKEWFLVAGSLIVISLVLLFLFREKPAVISAPGSKSEKPLPVSKAGEPVVPDKKETQDPEQLDYKTAANQNTISAYQEYIKKYPSGSHVREVETRIKELQEMPEQVRKAAGKVSKVIKVEKNEKGSWEADFGDGIIMVYIPPGKFIMGSDEDEAQSDEQPVHEIYLEGYWMGKYEITFEQYDKYCDETQKEKPDDGNWGRGKFPVISVSWHDALEYCKWLSAKTGFHFKLPTEAQWEKAARGTKGQKFPWGDQNANEDLANIKKTGELGGPVPVGSYPRGASPYGLLDMTGNVWEWCYDWYDWYKVDSPKQRENPEDIRKFNFRVLRGGCWFEEPKFVRAANRYGIRPTYRGYIAGFRLCMEN